LIMLEIKQLTASYGNCQILFGINLQINNAETVCILGRNGVGKTTTLRTIIGMLKPGKGSISFNGREIGGMEPYKISRLGIAYVPQGRHIFYNLTVKENLLIAARKGVNKTDQWNLEKIYQLFPILKNRENFMGTKLSGGEQQMLNIGRGLMQNPRLLILDEITEGLSPFMIKELGNVIQMLKKSDISILLAEQAVKFATAISSRCYILEKGQAVFSGEVKELSQEIILKHIGTA
jgi:branched-chain amino acid transport system ATP-binding protein